MSVLQLGDEKWGLVREERLYGGVHALAYHKQIVVFLLRRRHLLHQQRPQVSGVLCDVPEEVYTCVCEGDPLDPVAADRLERAQVETAHVVVIGGVQDVGGEVCGGQNSDLKFWPGTVVELDASILQGPSRGACRCGTVGQRTQAPPVPWQAPTWTPCALPAGPARR